MIQYSIVLAKVLQGSAAALRSVKNLFFILNNKSFSTPQMLVLTVISNNIICNLVRTLWTLKCNKKEEIVNTPQPSGTEAQLLEAEFQLGTIHILRKHFCSTKLNLTPKVFTKTWVFFVKTKEYLFQHYICDEICML